MPNIALEPLTLDEAKKALVIAAGIDDHDEDIERMVIAVREEAERLCQVPLIATTKTIYMDKFPSGSDIGWWDGERQGSIAAGATREIELPPGVLRSITSLTTYDDADSPTVFSSGSYFVDTERNRIVLRSGAAWPTVARVANGIKIIAEMGYATPAVVPQDLKLRMKERLLQRWRARGDPEKEPKIDFWFYGSWTTVRLGVRNL